TLRRDAPQTSAAIRGHQLARSDRLGAAAARTDHQGCGSGHRYVEHGRARAARTDSRTHRPAPGRATIADVRVVRLQTRDSGRRRLRVRRAQPAESLLGAFLAVADGS